MNMIQGINIADLVTWYVAFLFSFTAHEAAHAFAAMKGGDLTAYLGGQVTLNPVPHIKRSPFGTVAVPLISFFLFGWMIGWASAPYNPEWALRYPRRAAWMAAAGPAANLAIFVAAFVLLKFGLSAGIFVQPDPGSLKFTSIVAPAASSWLGITKLLSIFLILNLILFIFNLFPFPPLDGSSVITLLMSEKNAYRFTRFINQPMYSFLGIVLAWRMFGYIFSDLFVVVLRVLYSGI